MVSESIVVLDDEREIHRDIINYAINEKEYFSNYYNEEYGKLISLLDSEFKKIEKIKAPHNQIILDFDLSSIIIYKTIIYVFLSNNIEWINVNRMKRVTSILERLDGWIPELLVTDKDCCIASLILNDNKYTKL